MKIKSSFSLKKICNDYIVVPTGEDMVNFDAMITLNDTGAFLWEQLREEKTKEQLCEAVCAEYQVEADVAKADIDEFIAMLEQAKVLE